MASAGSGDGPARRKVGIVGFGHLGEYLYKAITTDAAASAALEVVFVWNRSAEKLAGLPADLVLTDLDDFARFGADIIVEVAHPSISASHGARFAATADYFVGSPTAFADPSVESALREEAAAANGFGVYVPSGALWGAADIQKMANRGSLKGLSITMKKHPGSLKVEGRLVEALAAVAPSGETVLYDGCVRDLCPLAPNNVNTMAAAAIAGHTLGFDKTQARLVADPSLTAHVIDIVVDGPTGADGSTFRVTTERYNPAAAGAVTGNATYASFLSSLLNVGGRGSGVHMC